MRDVKIRQNLFDALLSLRLTDVARTLWVDAICINQENIEERNHQVSQMAAIYGQAQSVVVWLGWPEENEVGSAIGFLGAIPRSGEEYIPLFYQDCLGRDHLSFRPQKYQGRADFRSIRKGLQCLSQKRYWTRLWVIQEALLATDVIVHCGRNCIAWKSLKTFCQFMQGKGVPFEDRELRDIKESPMMNFMAGDRQSSTLSLSYLCWLHGKSNCEKLLDKVFGLWALAPGCCQQAVPVDYSATFNGVMQKLWDHDIAAHGMPIDTAASVDEFKRGLFGSSLRSSD
ncbi:hypothetical protein L207DRAFT_518383 [Hyaloscypha variabilis F]|uniref:Heterokaryon incompatibility domain-containing protein n=1 Tax=Hyaloscypha variabilis (strain UAMH 11265 / GT02V1 / F) TaxID=1149755 RepID=A0A2J6R3H8_HYAVF|nr:hypothetical protein L207DRAFT_518383 [Hyaloscypha variabilis F]